MFNLGDRSVGSGNRCVVVGEAGVNHNGDVGLAHRLIDIAADSGADAVKFQTFRANSLASDFAGAAPYQRKHGAVSQREMLEAFVLRPDAWRALVTHAADRGIEFLSTAFDPDSLDLVCELGVRALKVPSGELDNLPFIKEIATRGLPMIISTGLGTLSEVEEALSAASAAPAVALLHCVTAYPAPAESCNMRAMTTMREQFGVPVGWSDHVEGHVTAVVAVALGASILGKHFTVDRRLPGPDHAASAGPEQFAEYIAAVRSAEAALGDGVKQPTSAELENRQFARRSYHATRDLSPGAIIGPGDVRLLRPALGLSPKSDILGRRIARPVAAGSPLTLHDIL